jgi:hypothetical protein
MHHAFARLAEEASMALELRPTFTIDLAESCGDVTSRLRDGLESRPVWTQWARVPGARSEQPCEGTYVYIALPVERQRFWSPWLQLSIKSHESGTQIFGRFSPKPEVWTAFALSYLFLGCVVFFSAMFGLAQRMLGLGGWSLSVTALACVMLVALFLASQIGKGLARQQMAEIRGALDEALQA